MRTPNRNLFVTLRMLRSVGIEADVRLAGERIHVFVRHPEPGQLPLSAAFEGDELSRAADWLTACVVHHYPRSELAKVWGLIFEAVATLPR